MPIKTMTIGFTKRNAESFFESLIKAGVKSVIDVRLHNTSQLAGFAKSDDLAYFLGRIGGIGYSHQPLLAPTEELLTGFKKQKGDWQVYQRNFLDLMRERQIEKKLEPAAFDGACLLCSEATPHHCHRRLVVEYLNDQWRGALQVEHL